MILKLHQFGIYANFITRKQFSVGKKQAVFVENQFGIECASAGVFKSHPYTECPTGKLQYNNNMLLY